MKLNYSYLYNDNNNYQLTGLPSIYAQLKNEDSGIIINNQGTPYPCKLFIQGRKDNITGGSAKMSCVGDASSNNFQCVDSDGNPSTCCDDSNVNIITQVDGGLQCDKPQTDKYDCVGGVCKKTPNGKFTNNTCNGLCQCTVGGKFNLNNLCGNYGTCIPNQGCIANCKDIPNQNLGTCTVDVRSGNPTSNNCGKNDTSLGVNFNECKKYLSLYPNYTIGGYNKCYCQNKIFTDSYTIGSDNLPSIINNYKDTADVTFRSIPWGGKDPAHTNCGNGVSKDNNNINYNIFSCIRDCPPGGKCNFLADNQDGIPSDKTGEDLLGYTGKCFFNCPDNTKPHIPTDCINYVHKWYCRNNTILKKNVA